MNPQICFVMAENDEDKFVEFVRENDCEVLKYILLKDEDPKSMCECTDEISLHYCILNKNCDINSIYVEDEYDGNIVKQLKVIDEESFIAKPFIIFSRSRLNVGVGRLYANTMMMPPADKAFVKEKYKIFKQWIVKNSGYCFKRGMLNHCYFLPDAAQQYKSDEAVRKSFDELLE